MYFFEEMKENKESSSTLVLQTFNLIMIPILLSSSVICSKLIWLFFKETLAMFWGSEQSPNLSFSIPSHTKF